MSFDINAVTLVGRLTKNPELKMTNSGKAWMTLSIANNTGKEDKEVNFFDVQLWGVKAETAAKFLSKGSQVAIQGRLNQRRWEYEGKKQYKVEIVANNVQFLSKPKSSNGSNSNHDGFEDYNNGEIKND